MVFMQEQMFNLNFKSNWEYSGEKVMFLDRMNRIPNRDSQDSVADFDSLGR